MTQSGDLDRIQFVSFPKSGRSWIRFMLGELGLQSRFRFQHDGFEFNDGACPPHDFSLERRLARYPADIKLVYLERDPRDVIVSLFHQVTGRFRDFFNYQGELSDFIRDPYFGAANLRAFQSMWADILTQRDFLLIRYETARQDPAGSMQQILSYSGLPVPDVGQLATAIEASSFNKMQALEKAGTYEQPWLRLRNDAPKVRRGVVGGYRDELRPEDIAFLESVFAS